MPRSTNEIAAAIKGTLESMIGKVGPSQVVADLSSTLKDLTLVSLLEDLKEGKLELARGAVGNSWYLRRRV